MFGKIAPMPDCITSYYDSDTPEPLNLTYSLFAEELGKIHITESVYIDTLEEHTHEFVEIACITQGCGIHIIDGESFRVRRGDIFLIDYGMKHTYEPISEPFRWINCIFRPQFLGGNYPPLSTAVQLLSYLHDHKLPESLDSVSCRRNLRSKDWDAAILFEEMLNEYSAKAPDYDTVLEHMLSIFLIRLSRQFFAENNRINAPFDKILPDIIRILNQSPPGSISEKELAERYYMSQSAFSNNFRKIMGCSFLDYITSLRIRHACALLITSDYTVGIIQNLCGYSDSKSFYRAFRRYTGMTPLEYKATHHISEDYDEHNILQ